MLASACVLYRLPFGYLYCLRIILTVLFLRFLVLAVQHHSFRLFCLHFLFYIFATSVCLTVRSGPEFRLPVLLPVRFHRFVLLPVQYGRSCPVFVRFLWTLRSVLVFVYHFRTFPIFSSALEVFIRLFSDVFGFPRPCAFLDWFSLDAAPISARRLAVDFYTGDQSLSGIFTHAQFYLSTY
jgi:hypothetical protein